MHSYDWHLQKYSKDLFNMTELITGNFGPTLTNNQLIEEKELDFTHSNKR